MKHVGVSFEEVIVKLYRPTTKQALAQYSPSLLVPCLRHGPLTIWDSLAIAEYVNELFPDKSLWPQSRATRAHARSVVAEMHSGFAALRRQWSFDIVHEKHVPLDEEGKENIQRIFEVWADCRASYAAGGPFLFGSYSLADIFYAPVISRFRTYGLKLIPPVAVEYMDAVWKLPMLQEWIAAARVEVANTQESTL
jgi:glutathione S-transferase